VEIRLYNVIYHLVEDIEKAVKGKIGPVYQETMIGKVEILQKFKISKVGIVAGCIVREGKVTRKSKIKVMRGSDLLFEGEIESLKRIKDEVSEVRAGTECGIRIKNFSNIEIGDILDVYETSIVS
jgi:translation initiation factor IF-2